MTRARNEDGISRSGGQESEALMSFLASVKEECKPPVYSAFICLMNAYHGNMLAVDALLDELFALFSPRVFLLAGIKPLVDKVHHPRIDELCGKANGNPGFTSTGLTGENSTVATTQSGANGTSPSGTMDGTPTSGVTPGTPVRDTVAVSGSGGLVADGSPMQSSPLSSKGTGARDGAKAVSVTGSVGSPVGSKTMSDANALSPGSAGGSGGQTTPTTSEKNTQGQTALGSPSNHAPTADQEDVSLSTQALSAQGLMSDMDPSVDHALLDFMMSDNSPTVGATGFPPEPPPIAPQHFLDLQQLQQQQQREKLFKHQEQESTSTPWPPLASPAQSGIPHSRPRSAASSDVGPSSNQDNRGAAQYALPRWQSVPNLVLGCCSIHAVQTPGCRDCQLSIQTPAPVFTRKPRVTTDMANSSVAVGRRIAIPTPKNLDNFNVHAGGNGPSLVPGRQSSSNAAGSDTKNGHGNSSADLESGYLGLGKRVWDEPVSTPSSTSTSPKSFFFPSATANGKTSRLPLKRRASADPSCMNNERTPVKMSDSSLGTPVSSTTAYSNGPMDGPLDSTILPSEFGVIDSAHPTKEEELIRGRGGLDGQGGGVRGGGNDGGGGGPGGGGAPGGGGTDRAVVRAPGGSDELEKLVMNVATKGMQQALHYGIRHTFTLILHKKDREIAELKEEALRWSANDTRLRQMNQQLLAENMQLRRLWEQSCAPNTS